MQRIIRIAGFALALLLIFLAVVVFTSDHLQRQNEQLVVDTIRTKTAELDQILALAQPPPPPWTEEYLAAIGRAIGGRASLRAGDAPPLTASASRWTLRHELPDTDGNVAATVEVRLPPPPSIQTLMVFHRTTALILLLALLMLLVVVLLIILNRPWSRPADPTLPEPGLAAGKDDRVIQHLAANTARQSVELEKEREDRQRAEADAHLKQILLNRALQERIDMGRDLHDGLIQSLYATGLTIQAARKAIDQNPAGARGQIDTALQTLNAAIREVRSYISGLRPEELRQRSFADSVRAIIEHLCAARELPVDLRIDEEAARRLSAEQATDLLQIIREAISNSVRHGHATQLTIRLHRNGSELCLAVHDNGRGFDSGAITRGNGLDNMQARAERLDARLQCQSAPGTGTRLTLTFTAPPSDSSS